MAHTIAVTTDFSSAAGHAFAAAAALARRRKECVSVLHVVDDPQIFTSWQVAAPLPNDSIHRQTSHRLEKVAENDPAFAGLEVRARVLCGEGPAAVGDFQAREDVDLIVVASSGSAMPGHPPLGGFAARVVHLVDCPILVFRESPPAGNCETTGGEGETAGGRFSPISFHPRRILAPHDFSSASLQGVDAARVWAEDFGAELRFVHAVRPRGTPTDYHESGHQAAGLDERESALKKLRRLESEGERVVESSAAGESPEKRQRASLVTSAAVRIGDPVLEILLEARAWKADMIAIASRGLAARAGVPLGSVTERVVEAADCPVLVVKRPA